MKHLSVIGFCAVFSVFVLGCGPKSPENFPKVYPCTVTVKKGGTPLQNATVTLYSTSKDAAFAVGGATDSSGVATIGTTQGAFQKEGSPAGTYKVTIMKAPELTGVLPDDQVAKMTQGERDAYMIKLAENQNKAKKVVPEKLSDPSKTSVSITVAESGGTLDVDVDTQK